MPLLAFKVFGIITEHWLTFVKIINKEHYFAHSISAAACSLPQSRRHIFAGYPDTEVKVS